MSCFCGKDRRAKVRATSADQRWEAPLTLFITHRLSFSSFPRKTFFTKVDHGAARARVVVPHLLSRFNDGRRSAQGLYGEEHAQDGCIAALLKAEVHSVTLTEHSWFLPPSRSSTDGCVPLPNVVVSTVTLIKDLSAHPGVLVPECVSVGEVRRGATVNL